jgi:hypothetical protein
MVFEDNNVRVFFYLLKDFFVFLFFYRGIRNGNSGSDIREIMSVNNGAGIYS